MSSSEIFEQVKELVASELKVALDEIKPESDFTKDLSADSLDIVEFIMTLEEKFDIKIPDDEAEKIKTVQDVVDYIVKHQSN